MDNCFIFEKRKQISALESLMITQRDHLTFICTEIEIPPFFREDQKSCCHLFLAADFDS